MQHFRELSANPRIADLLRRYSIDYLYTDVTPGRSSSYRLTLPPGNAGLTVVFELGGTRVYRIDRSGTAHPARVRPAGT